MGFIHFLFFRSFFFVFQKSSLLEKLVSSKFALVTFVNEVNWFSRCNQIGVYTLRGISVNELAFFGSLIGSC